MKKGQVSFFILIGLALLVIFMFLFYIKPFSKNVFGKEAELQESLTDFSAPVKNYVTNCLKKTGEEALFLIGFQGGYIYPIHYREELFHKRSFLFYEGVPYVPSITIMEDEISKYVDEKLEQCTNFSIFKDIKVNKENSTTKTTIHNKTVIIETTYPLTLGKSRSTAKLESFVVQFDSRLHYIRDVVEEIIYGNMENPGFIDYGYLYSLDLNFSVNGNYLDAVEYTLIDADVLLKNEPYVFTFYEQFDMSPLFNKNSGPRFTNLQDLEAHSDSLFYYDLNAEDAENDPLTYYADTMLFDVNPSSGEIRFVPDSSYAGEHLVPIYVEDTYGGVDISIIKVTII